MTHTKRILDTAGLKQILASKLPLKNMVFQGLDLNEVPIETWTEQDIKGAMCLGCNYSPELGALLRERKALLFPKFEELPYDPFRTNLYTPLELRQADTKGRTLDEAIYDHFLENGRFNPDFAEALAQRIHDYSIEDGLSELLGRSCEERAKLVGIMGGHAVRRDDPMYASVAELAWRLARAGYRVATGGGPGIMEAGNLGAYMANYDPPQVAHAIEILSTVPVAHMENPEYTARAAEVLSQYSDGAASLAIPTWFYGFEPTSLFPSHVAKYFSNSLREDGLLALCVGGVVYAPGSAGTNQEIFLDAAQNHYGSLDVISPMVFFGRDHYMRDTGIYHLLQQLACGQAYGRMLAITDSAEDAVRFLQKHPPILNPDTDPSPVRPAKISDPEPKVS